MEEKKRTVHEGEQEDGEGEGVGPAWPNIPATILRTGIPIDARDVTAHVAAVPQRICAAAVGLACGSRPLHVMHGHRGFADQSQRNAGLLRWRWQRNHLPFQRGVVTDPCSRRGSCLATHRGEEEKE